MSPCPFISSLVGVRLRDCETGFHAPARTRVDPRLEELSDFAHSCSRGVIFLGSFFVQQALSFVCMHTFLFFLCLLCGVKENQSGMTCMESQ